MQGSSPNNSRTQLDQCNAVDGIGYLHHKRSRSNEVSTWNVRACNGKSKHDIRLNWN